MENKRFIITVDKSTADQLVKEGADIVSIAGNVYTFINPPKKHFSHKIDEKKIKYTDMLSI